MKITLALLRQPKIVLLSLICVVVVAITALPSSIHPVQTTESGRTNNTRALQVVNIINNGDGLRLFLKNNTKKAIKGYVLSVGQVKMEEDFIYSDRVIAPGETYMLDIPGFQSAAAQILGVIFEDYSSDGDSQAIARIQNRRLGEKIQLQRLLPLFEKAALSTQSDTLQNLRAQITELSEQPDNGMPESVKSGLHNSKEEALQMLNKIEEQRQRNSSLSLQAELATAKTRLEVKAKKL